MKNRVRSALSVVQRGALVNLCGLVRASSFVRWRLSAKAERQMVARSWANLQGVTTGRKKPVVPPGGDRVLSLVFFSMYFFKNNGSHYE